MTIYRVLRAVYHRVRRLPLIGRAADAARRRFLQQRNAADGRYAEQQALLEAHGQAIGGLRQAVARNESALQSGHDALRKELDALRHDCDALRSGQPDVEEAIRHHLEAEIFKQADHVNRRLDQQRIELDNRIEFQRQELLFELRYSAARHGTAEESARPAPRILNAGKLDGQRRQGAIRLNVGCGHKIEPALINVDMRELPGVDVISTVDRLPFASGEVAGIYCAHLLEHFPLEQLRRSLLPDWVGLLQPGGELRAVVPDAAAMLDAYRDGKVDFSTLRLIIFGGQEYEGDFHHTMFTPQSLADLFVEAGLEAAEIEVRARPNGLCLECEVVGKKPCA